MKQGITMSLLLLLALVPSDAVPLDERTPRAASSLISAGQLRGTARAPDMPTVKHDKDAGEGYQSGSPLYDKQEQMRKDGTLESPPPPPGSPEEKKGCTLKNKTWYGCFWQQSLRPFLERLSDKDKAQENWWDNMLHALVSGLIHVVLVLIIAFLYKKFRTGPPKVLQDKFEPRPSWQYGPFECRDCSGEDWKLCFMSCCCQLIRWADTISNEKVKKRGLGLGYWPALGIALVLEFLSYFTGGCSMCVLCGIAVYYRGVIRKTFGHTSGGGAGGVLVDCCCWCWCWCCMTCQEAREVEQVRHNESMVDMAKDAASSVAGAMVRTGMPGTSG